MVNDTAQQKPLLAIRARFNSHSEFDYPINYTAFYKPQTLHEQLPTHYNLNCNGFLV
jgi:hypothetical protein